MERLRETMKEANAWKEKVEENSYLWREDRKEHMRQFLVYGRSLEGLANRSFSSTHTDNHLLVCL